MRWHARHRLLLRLVAAQVCIHACMTGFRMAAPLLVLREQAHASAIGFLLALFAATQVVLSLPAGRFVDARGLRHALGWSVCIAVTAACMATLAPVYGVLCLTALGCGGASGLALIALQKQVGQLAQTPVELRQFFSWLAIGPAISNFLGPVLTGLVIDLAGFQAAFAGLAILPTMAWLLLRTRSLPASTSSPPPHAGTQRSSWDLLQSAPMRRLLLVNWLLASCWDIHTFVVPIIGHERGLSASTIGMILGSFAVAATLIRVLIPLIATHLREARVVGLAMLSTSCLLGLYPLAPNALSMGVLSMGLGLSLGSVQPMMMSVLHQITPSHRHGEALGLRAMAINASSVVMPLLFGAGGGLMGVAWMFWIVGGVVGLGSQLTRRWADD